MGLINRLRTDYLLSGGVSLRSLAPGASQPVLAGLERLLGPVMDKVALFAGLVLRRRA